MPAPESTLGVELQSTTWTLSALDTFGCHTERHFKNSGFNCYHQKTSIKICICTPNFMQMVNLLPVNNHFFFYLFFLSCLVKTIVCVGTRWQNLSYSILVHKILKQVLKDLAPGAKEKEVLSQKGREFENH